MEDKTIVTHRGALNAKYGPGGFAKIRAALAALVVADKKLGIKTGIVYLDDTAAMKKLGAKALVSVGDRPTAKAAIDGVFKAIRPDYLMILGSTDVVPHQDMKNPAFDAGDDDKTAWGDLPYACDTAYSRDPAKFIGPTRVVGRLPDLTGATEPSHLLSLLRTAAKRKSLPPGDYTKYFSVSALVWQGSTKLSLDNIFGNTGALQLAPTKGPTYPPKTLGSRMHFINCHGSPADPTFYGQKGTRYPESLNTKATRGKITEGTVAAVECCYGGELYDSVTLALDLPICQSYLAQGAHGYLGSTTIAYGPADENGSADLICQYFLLSVLGGASIGRAALVARQQFIEHCEQMDPMDLKTLAQFNLYGDPSAHPVLMSKETQVAKGTTIEDTLRFRRSERRAKLKQNGEHLLESKPTASKRTKGGRTSAQAKAALANIAARGGLSRNQAFSAFKVKGAKQARGGPAKVASAPSQYYLTVGKPRGSDRRVAVIAKEAGGKIKDYCIYHER